MGLLLRLAHRDLRSFGSLKTALLVTGFRSPTVTRLYANIMFLIHVLGRCLSMQRLGCSPVVHPMVTCEHFPGQLLGESCGYFDCLPSTLFQNHIKIVCAHTNEYQPHIINSNLPEELWQFTACDDCGRKPLEDAWRWDHRWALIGSATWPRLFNHIQID